MTFDEWYKAEGFKLMSSGASIKDILYQAYQAGLRQGTKDKEYDV